MTTPRYYVADNMDFVISDYNSAPPFASFLPGIAGLWGVPMWVFYANRGQGITSFGVLDKDGSIMEFHPADKAYRYAARYGFRTFLTPGNHEVEVRAVDAAGQERSVVIPVTVESGGFPAWAIVLIALGGVLVIAGAGSLIWRYRGKIKSRANQKVEESKAKLNE